MLVFITVGTPVASILQLQEVRLREVNTGSTQRIGVLLLESLTSHEVHMVQAHGAVPSQRILNQGISIFTMCLGETLIFFCKIYAVTLNPGRNPGLIVARCSTIRKIDLISQLMILALDSHHIEQVDICRGSTYKTVNDGVTGQHLVNQQGVHSRDITMNCIVIHTIAIGIILITTGRTYHIIEYPCAGIVSLDGWLHVQHTAKHVAQVTIQTLHILTSVGYGHIVLVRVRIDQTGTELHELSVHRIVHTGSITLKVRTSALESTLLLEIVKTNIIGIINTTTAQVHTMVLADTGLEGLTQPVGIGAVLEMIVTVRTLGITTGNGDTGILSSDAKITAVLLCISQVIDILLNLINTEVTLIVHLQLLLLLTTLSRDNHHTISCTGTVDSTCRSILQHLDGLDIVWREVANRGTHGHTVDHIQRSGATETTDTTDTNQWVGTGLTVRGNLHTGDLTFQHRGDIGVRHTLQFVGIHDRHRTRQVGFLLNTITYNHHLLKHLSVAFQNNLTEVSASVDRNLKILETYIAYHDSGISRNAQFEITVEVGNGSRLSTLHLDSSANQRFPILVNNLTTNLDGLLGHRCHHRSRTDRESN